MASVDDDTLAVWAAEGFTPDDTRAWIEAASVRFTPYTAKAWAAEGFGPADAALWSEVFASPFCARIRRSAGYASPFDGVEGG